MEMGAATTAAVVVIAGKLPMSKALVLKELSCRLGHAAICLRMSRADGSLRQLTATRICCRGGSGAERGYSRKEERWN